MEILVAERVWDGTSSRPTERGFVRIEDGTITAVGREADLPDGTAVRNLGDVTLLPGLINAHVHITFCASQTVLDDYLAEKQAGFDTLLARATENLGRAVDVGVTTIRDLGTLNDVVFTAQARVRDGTLRGPDIVAAGEGITSPGGHCHFFGIECQGEDVLRAAVRRQHEAGADLIKVFATGGYLTPNTDPFLPQYTVEELRAVVDEARRLDMPVSAHAHAYEGIRRSVTARVNTIEHCNFETPDGIAFDERIAEEMAEAGIAAVPTVGASIAKYLKDPTLFEQMPADRRERVRGLIGRIPEVMVHMARMREIGVTIIAGTDAGIPNRPFDGFPSDIALLADSEPGIGMGTRDALIAATSGCAQTLGLTDRGRVEPGRRADLLAVRGNPLADIADIQQTEFVMTAGRVAVDRATRREQEG